MNTLLQALKSSFRFLMWTTLLLGLAYPLAVTGLLQGFFPHQAQGSLVYYQDRVIGSDLLGQDFQGDPQWFQGRASAVGYKAEASGASNLNPWGPEFKARVFGQVTQWKERTGSASGPTPLGLVTTSASGLDPDILETEALWQVPMVAKARGLPEEDLVELIQKAVNHPVFPWDGPPRVRVQSLNILLAHQDGKE